MAVVIVVAVFYNARVTGITVYCFKFVLCDVVNGVYVNICCLGIVLVVIMFVVVSLSGVISLLVSLVLY